MMYPPLAKVKYEELGDVFRNYKILGLSLVQNWVIGPILMFVLAIIFLRDYPEYMVGLIMIGLARCIAMVIVWNELAKGDTEYAAGLVAFNSVFQVLFFSVYAYIFVTVLPPLLRAGGRGGRRHHRPDRQERLHLPRHPLPRRHAHPLHRAQVQGPRVVRAEVHPAHQPAHAHRPAVHHRRDVLAQGRATSCSCRSTCVRIAIPLLIYFVVMFFVQLLHGAPDRRRLLEDRDPLASPRRATTSSWPSRWPSPSSASNSGEAFAAVIGPLVEVPVLIGLVNVALWLGRKYWGVTRRAGAGRGRRVAEAGCRGPGVETSSAAAAAPGRAATARRRWVVPGGALLQLLARVRAGSHVPHGLDGDAHHVLHRRQVQLLADRLELLVDLSNTSPWSISSACP